MNLNFYKYRNYYLTAVLSLWAVSLTAIQSLSVFHDYTKLGIEYPYWQALCAEFTSVSAVFLLVYPMILFTKRYSLETGQLKHWGLHLLILPAFSTAHILIMIGFREIWYNFMNLNYEFGDWIIGGLYEFRKDTLTFFTVCISIYLWALLIRRIQGEAKVIHEEDSKTRTVSASDQKQDKLLIKKMGNEYLISIPDIDWIEASGNYVNLHIGKNVYPMRGTMANTAQHLGADKFCRVHRSFIVNVDRISSIRPLDTGDFQLVLTTGVELKLSRRYKDQIKSRFPL